MKKTLIGIRTIGASLLLMVVLLTVVGVGVVQAAPRTATVNQTQSWHIVPSPNTPATYNSLGSLAAFSANDVWATGTAQYYPSPTDPILEHWNGSTWKMASPPASATGNGFGAMTIVPGTPEVWVLSGGGFTELWNGSAWQQIPTANVNTPSLSSIVALSTTNAWLVGNYYQSPQMPNAALIEHWNGTTWSQVTAAYPKGSQHTFLNAITALSATNIWAVGSYDNGITSPGYTLVEHWNGTTWSLISAPNPGPNNNVLLSVSRIPNTNDLWAVGFEFNGSQTQNLIEYWNGTVWSLVTVPQPGVGGQLSGVVALSANSAWVVGNYTNGQGDEYTLTEYWNGTTWNVISSPNPSTYSSLSSLVSVPGSTTLWAVGSYYNSQSDELTLIEQYS